MGRQKAHPTHLETRDEAGGARFQKLRHRAERWVEADHDLHPKVRKCVIGSPTRWFDDTIDDHYDDESGPMLPIEGEDFLLIPRTPLPGRW